MKQKIVGTYPLGWGWVQIVAREGHGGEFWLSPGDIDCPRIKIGLDSEQFEEVAESLLHEIEELSATILGTRFRKSAWQSEDSSAYTFVMTHQQFSEIVCWSAKLLVACLDVVNDLWSNRQDNPDAIFAE
jgi:hypothetical protein